MRVWPNYKQGITCTIELICSMKLVSALFHHTAHILLSSSRLGGERGCYFFFFLVKRGDVFASVMCAPKLITRAENSSSVGKRM